MKTLWIFILAALFYMVQTSGSLHAMILRYHYGLDKIQIGHALFVSYLILALAPLGLMWLKSHLKSLWAVFGLLLMGQSVLLWLFPQATGVGVGMAVFCALMVLASLGGSLYRAASATALPVANRDRLFIYLMFTAALAYGGLAYANSWWVDGHLTLAYRLLAGLGMLTAWIAVWGGRTDPQKSSGMSRITMMHFWRQKHLFSMMILLCVAVMASNAGDMYMAFFVRETLGGRESHVSLAWAVGVLTELPLYFLALLWLKRFSAQSLLMLAFAGIALRMGLLALAPNLTVFLLAQALDGFYSGVLFSVFPIYLARYFSGVRLAFANLFAGIFYLGLGRALTGLLSSWIWEWHGLRTLFAFWSLCLLACMAVYVLDPWGVNRRQQ